MKAIAICPICKKKLVTDCKPCIEAGTSCHVCKGKNEIDVIENIKWKKINLLKLKLKDILFIEGKGEYEVVKISQEAEPEPKPNSKKKNLVRIYNVAYLHLVGSKSILPTVELRQYKSGKVEFRKD